MLNMNQPFVLTLPNERGKYINVISISLVVISLVFFLHQQIRQGSGSYLLLVSCMIIAAGLIWNLYKQHREGTAVYYYLILLAVGATWLAMPYLQWMSILFFLLSFMEKKARLNLEIIFRAEKIEFSTLFGKHYYWNQFNNILLKDGMLTLDFKNNALFQKLTCDELDDSFESAFNAFCRQQLESAELSANRIA